MTGQKRSSRSALVALALCTGLTALPAAAERGSHHRDGHFLHFEEVKSQLNLDTYQQGLWDAAVAAGKAAREAQRTRHAPVRQAIAEEAAKPADVAPDLARIAAEADKARDASSADRRQVREQWLKLYSTFKPEQIAVAKTLLSERLARMDTFRERMKERFGNR